MQEFPTNANLLQMKNFCTPFLLLIVSVIPTPVTIYCGLLAALSLAMSDRFFPVRNFYWMKAMYGNRATDLHF